MDEAIAHLQQALEIKPDHVYARRNLEAALSERERILSKNKPGLAESIQAKTGLYDPESLFTSR